MLANAAARLASRSELQQAVKNFYQNRSSLLLQARRETRAKRYSAARLFAPIAYTIQRRRIVDPTAPPFHLRTLPDELITRHAELLKPEAPPPPPRLQQQA